MISYCPCLQIERTANFHVQATRRTVPVYGHQPEKLVYRKWKDLWHVTTCLDRFHYGHNRAFLSNLTLHFSPVWWLQASLAKLQVCPWHNKLWGLRKITPHLFIVFIRWFLLRVSGCWSNMHRVENRKTQNTGWHGHKVKLIYVQTTISFTCLWRRIKGKAVTYVNMTTWHI